MQTSLLSKSSKQIDVLISQYFFTEFKNINFLSDNFKYIFKNKYSLLISVNSFNNIEDIILK